MARIVHGRKPLAERQRVYPAVLRQDQHRLAFDRLAPGGQVSPKAARRTPQDLALLRPVGDLRGIVLRALPGRAVPPLVGGPLRPALRLLVQVRVTDKPAAVEEALPHVADRPLHLATASGLDNVDKTAAGSPSARRNARTPRSAPAPRPPGGRQTTPRTGSGRTAAPSSAAGKTAAASSPAPPAARDAELRPRVAVSVPE